MRYIWENSVRNCAVCIANMPRVHIKALEPWRTRKGRRKGSRRKRQREPLVLVQILFFAGLHCKAPQYNKPTNLLYGGPVEAEVFTGRIKKSTGGPDWLNRCFGSSKALVPWLCHTLQVKHEAEERLLRRDLPIGDVFCVQAAIALTRFPLAEAWW